MLTRIIFERYKICVMSKQLDSRVLTSILSVMEKLLLKYERTTRKSLLEQILRSAITANVLIDQDYHTRKVAYILELSKDEASYYCHELNEKYRVHI